MREQASKWRFRAETNADSRNFAVDAGEEMREMRIAWASGMDGGRVALTRRVCGWEKFAYRVGGRWICPGELIDEVYTFTERAESAQDSG